MGIYRVTLAGLDTTTNGAVDGYQDYSCRSRPAQLGRGTTYTLAVRTNSNADETVRAWIDFNGDGTFVAGEQVLAATGRQHSASFVVPTSAPTGVALRLRIAADYINAPLPTACSTSQYSQTEDYRVVVVASVLPRPVARFTALDTVSCGGPIAFQDQSFNAPTAWRWNFGDGTGSTQQHPNHTYAQPGTYAVRLRACNITGCDSLTKVGYVLVRADAPRSAPCLPVTTAYCCGFGLTRVRLASVDHVSADGSVGYEDFSCVQRAIITADQPTPLQLTTGVNAHDLRVYLDLNDNGQFDLPMELLYQGLNVRNPVVSLQVASTTAGLAFNRPLRLRLWADAAGAAFAGPCTAPQNGQVEDYSVLVLPNASGPIARFALAYQQACGPVQVAVTNQTTGGATSYHWDFGDGTTSTATNPPLHVYTTGGVYDVTLVARNTFGTDTMRQTVVVAGNCPSYCVASGTGGDSDWKCYFTRVQLANLDNTSMRGAGLSYRDYTALSASLQQGQVYTLRAESLPWLFAGAGPWTRVTAWVDYNQDGNFSAAERLTPVVSFSPYQLTFRVPLSARPGATRLRLQIIAASYSIYLSDPYNACPPAYHVASTEDYTVLVHPAAVAPQVGFRVQVSPSCNGLVQFRDTSWAAPTRWRWRFGDGATSTQQSPQHRYTQSGTYTVSLAVANRYGADSVTRVAYVTISSLLTGPRPAECVPLDGPSLAATLGTAGVSFVQVGGLNYNNQGTSRYAPYRDETCAQPAAMLTAGAGVPITVRGLTNYAFQVRVWLDANDDGILDSGAEQIYVGPIGSGTLTVPSSALRNQPLRLRVWWMTDIGGGYAAVDGGSCFRSERNGQVRDFTAIISGGTTTDNIPGVLSVTWNIFPTCTTNSISVSSTSDVSGALQIRDVFGRIAYTRLLKLLPGQSIDLVLPHIASGMYFVYLAGTGPKRIIIQ